MIWEEWPMMILEQEAFQQWKDNPLTREFLSILKDRRQHLMEAWGRGQPLMPEQQAQAVLLGQLAEINFEDVQEMAGIEVSDGGE
jgi:hypothetical protein